MARRKEIPESLRQLLKADGVSIDDLAQQSGISITQQPDNTGVTSESKNKRREKTKIKRVRESDVNWGCVAVICWYSGTLAYTFFLVIAPGVFPDVDRDTVMALISIDFGAWIFPILFMGGLADQRN